MFCSKYQFTRRKVNVGGLFAGTCEKWMKNRKKKKISKEDGIGGVFWVLEKTCELKIFLREKIRCVAGGGKDLFW